jgi:DNA invertase Pin-like site-specific DNA recombinase
MRHDFQIIREFIDEAESGRISDRPAFREMITLAKAKHSTFEVILVWKLNRFARNRADSIVYKKLLRDRGIKLISINEPLEDSPSGHLLEGVIETIDEFYSENLGEDIKRGMRENAERGFFNGSRPPYGFHKVDAIDGDKTRHRLEPDPEGSTSRQVVQLIFNLALKGMGCKEIAKSLNKEGYRTSEGQKWGRTTVQKILNNEAYCGTLVWGGRQGTRLSIAVPLQSEWKMPGRLLLMGRPLIISAKRWRPMPLRPFIPVLCPAFICSAVCSSAPAVRP